MHTRTLSDLWNDIVQRDGEMCVVCGARASRLHFIMEPRLWDEPYVEPDNAALLCDVHYDKAMSTLLDVESLRGFARRAGGPFPPHLYAIQRYDRWGNPILEDGRRARGELFFDEIANEWLTRGRVLNSFTEWARYPRTHLVHWSELATPGDRFMPQRDCFEGKEIVVTEKMDGENVSLYREFRHGRSVRRIDHDSRKWLDEFWMARRQRIPPGWRLCGEYLFVRHTVPYPKLPSFFLGFAVWDERNTCLDWDDTLMFFDQVDIEPVPQIFCGVFDMAKIHEAWRCQSNIKSEGYVIRTKEAVDYRRFRWQVGKFIRGDYVQSEPVNRHVTEGLTYETNALTSMQGVCS